jgi:hypothetical protein
VVVEGGRQRGERSSRGVGPGPEWKKEKKKKKKTNNKDGVGVVGLGRSGGMEI